jgi:hypothetical protein
MLKKTRVTSVKNSTEISRKNEKNKNKRISGKNLSTTFL